MARIVQFSINSKVCQQMKERNSSLLEFASTKAWSRSGNHWNTAFFDRRGRKGTMIVVSSFEKLPSWFTNPNNERRSVMVSGDFSRSPGAGLDASSWQAKFTEINFRNSNRTCDFVCLRVTLCWRQRSRKVQACFFRIGRLGQDVINDLANFFKANSDLAHATIILFKGAVNFECSLVTHIAE